LQRLDLRRQSGVGRGDGSDLLRLRTVRRGEASHLQKQRVVFGVEVRDALRVGCDLGFRRGLQVGYSRLSGSGLRVEGLRRAASPDASE
jgi:hypothetical protein